MLRRELISKDQRLRTGVIVTLRDPESYDLPEDAPLFGIVLRVGSVAKSDVLTSRTQFKRSAWRQTHVLRKGERLICVQWRYTDERQLRRLLRWTRNSDLLRLVSVPSDWLEAETRFVMTRKSDVRGYPCDTQEQQ
jgi:hypothetical protein